MNGARGQIGGRRSFRSTVAAPPGKERRGRTDWGATIVLINQVGVPEKRARGLRLLRVTGVTFAVSGVTIATLMIVGLTLDGAL